MNCCVKTLGLLLLIAFALTVIQAQENEKRISRKRPPAVENTVARESQGATIRELSTETDHGQKVYELSLEANGHTKDILIDKEGNILEIEEQVSMDSLPSAVQEAIKKVAGTGTIGVIESVTRNGTLEAYEAHVKRGRKRSEIKVSPSGEVIK